MITYDTILAVIDNNVDTQPALSRALELAEKTDATVIALLVVYDFSYEMTTMLSKNEREAMRDAVLNDQRNWLNEEIRRYTKRPVEVVIKWQSRVFEAIIGTAIQCNADLVVKSSHQTADLVSVIFTPTDWHLLRKCPLPVLLVKEHAWPLYGNIIAAINVGSEDREHLQLNNKITRIAQDYASLLTGNVHLVSAYPPAPVSIALEIPEFDIQAYHQAVQQHHQQEMVRHAEQYQQVAEHCHVREGLPEKVVAHMADSLDAELVVIGTVGRVGLSAAFIGNTAERVIDTLQCDVLAIKPDGFESPIF